MVAIELFVCTLQGMQDKIECSSAGLERSFYGSKYLVNHG